MLFIFLLAYAVLGAAYAADTEADLYALARQTPGYNWLKMSDFTILDACKRDGPKNYSTLSVQIAMAFFCG